ncbi:cell wall integrity and stress response component 3 [Drosophila hydei]|uniref:Cell wall integrity and stress response component 3 n=1 Tax=Drosophila hydei TaxID=7224 RepID=A0A6J1LWM5_DROHY|nr:cell wall integrity and stress response component 3 [Drosophila hydei]
MFLATLLACLAATVWAGPSQALGESKLLQAMRSTNALQQSDPVRSMACFQYYSEVFDQLLQQYENQYEACQNTSQLQMATLNWIYQTKLSVLSNNVISACQLIENCDNQNDTGLALACYSQVGAEDAKTMYNISGTASQYNGEFNQQKQVIDYQEEECANESRRTYEVSTEQTYVSLQGCLMGNEPVPTTTSSTTAGPSSSPVIRTTTPGSSTTGESTVEVSSSSTTRTSTTAIPVTTTTTEDPFQLFNL